MKKYIPWIIAVCLAVGWFVDKNISTTRAAVESPAINSPVKKQLQKDRVWEAFEVSGLIAKRKKSGRWYLPFLKRPTLRMGLYSLPIGATDNQPVHDEDEVYYIENGKATLRVGKEDQPVKKGSIIFVKRGIPHNFHSIIEPLDVLVFFSSAQPNEKKAVSLHLPKETRRNHD